MAVGDLSFAFNPAVGETPQTVAAKRALALAIMGNTSHAPRDIGEGLNSIGQAIMFRKLMGGVNSAEASGMSSADKMVQGLFGGGDQGQFPAAPSTSAAPAPSPGATSPNAQTSDASGASGILGAPGGDYFSAIRSAESNGSDTAKNPKSSATGRYQFTTGTWGDVANAHPELGLTPDGRLDPAQQEKAIRAFTADNAGILSNAGIPTTGGNLYAAHFLGASGATNVLTQPDNSPVSAHVAPAVVQANPFLAGMTVGQFKQWAAKKGGSGPVDLGGSSIAAAPVAPAPVQTASLDPSVGMAQTAPSARPLPPEFAAKGITPEQWAAMNAPDGAPQPTASAAPSTSPSNMRADLGVPFIGQPLSDAQRAAQQAQMAPALAQVGQPYSPPPMPQPYASIQQQASSMQPPMDAKAAIARAMAGQGQSFPPELGPQDVAAMMARPKPADAVPFNGPPELNAQSFAPSQPATDAKQAILQSLAGQNSPVAPQARLSGAPVSPQNNGINPGDPGATSPAGQRVLAAMMQQQPMSGGSAPLPMQGGPLAAAPQASPQVAQATPQGGPDLSQIPAMAGGTADVVQPGAQRGGPTPQDLIRAAGNPWVMQRYGPIVDAMISQQMTPHKLELVDLGNGVKAQMDTITGRIVGQIKGQPDLKSIKDAAGNEYLFNPADPTHPITADTLLGGQAGGQPGAQSAQADPYASPFPRTMPRTDVMKDYEGYLAQSKALNQPPMTFNDYQMDLKKQGAQSIVFANENEAQKKIGEAIGGNMADYIDGAKDARTKLQALNTIKGVLDTYGDNISTGPGAQTMLSLKQGLANIFPGMADAATPTEMLQKMSTQLATADAKGLASRPTQFDFATYLKNNPGIQMSIQGQKALVDLKLQQAQHDYELGNMATHKQYSSHPEEWADVVAKYDQEHPLINPLTNKPADPNATDFPAPKGGAAATGGPKPGAIDSGYRFKGGDPADKNNWEPVQ